MEFDDIVRGGEVILREAVLLGTQESLRLDFKSQSDAGEDGALFRDGRLTKSGKQSLAKALSAFSNSAGGVIVFGVKCRRNEDGVDCAQELEPILAWDRALSEISSAVGDLLQPKNEGINVAGLPSSADRSLGYIVVDVPRSERRPHRSEASGQKHYFKRSGSASYAMEHYDIEDAFRRTVAPDIELSSELDRFSTNRNGRGAGWADIKLKLAIRNVGRVTAKAMLFQITAQTGIEFGIGTPYQVGPNTHSTFGGRRSVTSPPDYVVHPGDTRFFEQLTFRITRSEEGERNIADLPFSRAFLSIEYMLGAENMALKPGVLQLPPAVLWGEPPFLDR